MSVTIGPYHPVRVRLGEDSGQSHDDVFVRFACAQFYSVAYGTQYRAARSHSLSISWARAVLFQGIIESARQFIAVDT